MSSASFKTSLNVLSFSIALIKTFSLGLNVIGRVFDDLYQRLILSIKE